MKRLAGLAARPRVALMAAMLLTRGAGFATSLVLARSAGVAAVGVYSAVLTSASIVVSPLTGVVQNTSTALAARADTPATRKDELGAMLLAVAAAICCASVLAFLLLMHQGLGDADIEPLWLVAGVCWIVGNLCFGAVQGHLFGGGRFVEVAATVGVVSLAVVLLCVPVVTAFGLGGALGLVIVNSLAPLALLAPRMLSWRAVHWRGERAAEVLRLLRDGLPTVAAAGLNNATNWFCFVYLAQRHHGFEGVGLLAIANQWLALMLIPSTSWGAITLKTLVDAAGAGRPAVRQAVLRLTAKDLGATAAIWLAVAALSVPLSLAYGVRGQGLATLLIAAGLVAMGNAMCMVFERVFIATRRQGAWFACSTAGLIVQGATTLALIERGPWAVLAGVFAGYAVAQALCWWVFWRSPA